jgi:glycosyltransferase involved in cell wall biosynthesis
LTKPRLLIVLNRLSIGGPATNTLAVAQALKDDFEIVLVAGEPVQGEESAAYLLEQYNGFHVQMLKSMKRAVLPMDDYHAYKQMKQIIKTFQPHIIHTHGSKPGVIARWAAKRCHVPVITHTYHGHVFHSYFSPFVSGFIVKLERWLASHSSFIIAINERLQQELTSLYKIAPPEKIKLNRLGIDVESLQDADGSKRKKFRTEFQLQEHEIAIGIIGRLVPVKQHHIFIDLISQLVKESVSSPLRFFIIGDGGEKQKLEQQLQNHHITYTTTESQFNNAAPVVFTSWRKDMDAVMAGLDIVTLTSQNEGTPISIMEAMAAGKPVVAADVGGIAELFQNNTNGLLYQQPSELFQQTLQLIQSPQIRDMIGNNARAFAATELTIRKQVQSLRQTYLASLSAR